jgi:hypothetical protein
LVGSVVSDDGYTICRIRETNDVALICTPARPQPRPACGVSIIGRSPLVAGLSSRFSCRSAR